VKLDVVILAAGQGKRMFSALPKVLHQVGGRPLLAHVLASAKALAPRSIHVVYGHGGETVRDAIAESGVAWVRQPEQRGTGDALAKALPDIADDGVVLVLYGDVPLIGVETLRRLVSAAEGGLGLLTAKLDNPDAYGRIVRDATGHVKSIVEARDATPEQLAVREINTGFLAAPATSLRRWVGKLDNRNAQGEYYLTDVVAMAAADGTSINTCAPGDIFEVLGVNSKLELATLERILQKNQADELMKQGVSLRDPARFDLRGTLKAGRDVVIDVNVVLEGEIELGDGVSIGPNNFLRNTRVGARTEILPNCVIEDAVIGADCRLGPFARLRPGNKIGNHVHVGNFVEIKNSTIADGSKINHLSYIGDTDMGGKVNVGAGTITCNYDGANKYRTTIKDGAFIGSDTQLVAPVTVGENATIGAGSTIVRDAPDNELTLTRSEQKTVRGWKRPIKGEPKKKK